MQQALVEKIKTVTTIRQAINGTQLRKFEKAFGATEAAQLICEMIISQARYFNLVATISIPQAFDLAEMILQDYSLLTVEDLAMMFREAKMMKDGYEKPYQRMDGRLVFSWLNTYLAERNNELDRMYENEKKELHNQAYEAAAVMLLKIPALQHLIEKKPENQNPVVRRTMENDLENVRKNMITFSEDELKKLRKRYEMYNLKGQYDEMIKDIENEIILRVSKKIKKSVNS